MNRIKVKCRHCEDILSVKHQNQSIFCRCGRICVKNEDGLVSVEGNEKDYVFLNKEPRGLQWDKVKE